MTSVYQTVLGARIALLPAPVRKLHMPTSHFVASGMARIEREGGALASWLGDRMGFPPAGDDIPLRFSIDVADGVETWTRNFGGHRMQSRLWARGPILFERLSLLRLGYELDADADGLRMRPISIYMLGIPLPRFLWPVLETRESAAGGRYHFMVRSRQPILGLAVNYSGWLEWSEPGGGT